MHALAIPRKLFRQLCSLPADAATVMWSATPTPLDQDDAFLLVMSTIRSLESNRFGGKKYVFPDFSRKSQNSQKILIFPHKYSTLMHFSYKILNNVIYLLREVTVLDLGFTQCDDAMVTRLASECTSIAPKLKTLILRQTCITDKALESLHNFLELKYAKDIIFLTFQKFSKIS